MRSHQALASLHGYNDHCDEKLRGWSSNHCVCGHCLIRVNANITIVVEKCNHGYLKQRYLVATLA